MVMSRAVPGAWPARTAREPSAISMIATSSSNRSGDPRRKFRAEHHQHCADDDEAGRVTESPAHSEQRRLHAIALAAHERRHRRKVIGLERVAHAEQRSEPGTGEELENWHNAEPTSILREYPPHSDWRRDRFGVPLPGVVGGPAYARHALSRRHIRRECRSAAWCSVRLPALTQERVSITPEVRALLLAGVLGGFTTFSSYMNESFVLVREGQFLWAGAESRRPGGRRLRRVLDRVLDGVVAVIGIGHTVSAVRSCAA